MNDQLRFAGVKFGWNHRQLQLLALVTCRDDICEREVNTADEILLTQIVLVSKANPNVCLVAIVSLDAQLLDLLEVIVHLDLLHEVGRSLLPLDLSPAELLALLRAIH